MNKNIYSIFIMFICLSFSKTNAQIINKINSPKDPKLKLGLSTIANMPAGATPRNIANYNLFSFKGETEKKILVDIISNDNSLKKTLINNGAELVSSFNNRITCWLEVSKINDISKNTAISWIQPVLKPIHNAASINPPVRTQGDAAQRSDIARQLTGLNGTGVKIGVLSDSYNNLGGAANGVNSGELPGTGNPLGYTTPVTVLNDLNDNSGSDEGRAMLEIIHDIAPAAELYFYTAFQSETDFANGIRALADAGCKVIVDDVIYFDEPYFQDGIIAQAVDYAVNVKGATYFSSAGNQSNLSYEAPFKASTYHPFNDDAIAHNFGSAENPVYFLPITVGSRGLLTAFQWDEPYLSAGNGSAGSASDLDIFVLSTTDNITYTVEAASFDNNIGADPFEIFEFSRTGTFYILITKYAGPAPTRIKFIDYARLSWDATPSTIEGIKSGTTTGHANAEGAIAVGAASYDKTPAFGVNPPQIEYFSSRGGTSVLFNASGNRLASPVDRRKPEIVAPDRANTSFFIPGYDYEGDGFPNFAGTSAAAPHAAAVAGLMLQGNPSLTSTTIRQYLIKSCVDMDDPNTSDFDTGFDYATGAGLIKADEAVLSTLNPNCPSTSITITRSTTFCEGDSVILNANMANGYIFQWQKNGIDISGANQAQLVVKSTGQYSVNITNLDCTLPSRNIDITALFAVAPPITINRTIEVGTLLTNGNGLQATAFCPTEQTATYAGPSIGYDGNRKSGPDPTASINGINGKIKYVRISITWQKRNGGTINDCGTTGGASYPYNNEVSFKIKGPDNTIISLLNPDTYAVGRTSSGLVTTVFDDGGITVGTIPNSGTFKPVQRLSNLNGKDPNGIWTLLANDNGTLDPLCVESFSVTVFTDASGSSSTITWWDSPSGGLLLTRGNELIPEVSLPGNYTYYVEAACPQSTIPCPTSVRKAVTLNITPCNFKVNFDYVKAGNPFTFKFPLKDNIVIAASEEQTSILVKPSCEATNIESFKLQLTGPPPFESYQTVENIFYYSLFNNTGVNVLGRILPVGSYTLTATGYSQDNATGNILYGPVVIHFTIVQNSATISAPILASTTLCAGSNFSLNFNATGSFDASNQFEAQLSDINGIFDNPLIIGSSASIGSINCSLPIGLTEGTDYKIRIVSTNQTLESIASTSSISINKYRVTLSSPANDINNTSTQIKVGGIINATNKINSSTNANYQAGKAIELNAGFEINNSIFKAEIKGCGN
ncbi:MULTISPECIES: 3-coathanger stack domain-containing protein [Emticicia]|uniref:3-coathanger stack domain-containing protein n=1 Tax=Emticicia TaxID=312278 RepID=UPI0018D33851|nr:MULTISPECIES: 3-coathanger stack domain-containing protein [Emticicia]